MGQDAVLAQIEQAGLRVEQPRVGVEIVGDGDQCRLRFRQREHTVQSGRGFRGPGKGGHRLLLFCIRQTGCQGQDVPHGFGGPSLRLAGGVNLPVAARPNQPFSPAAAIP